MEKKPAPAATGLRKRQQINKANRTMFMWIAGASAIVGVALVLTIFLFQKILFGEKVLNEKGNTVSVLQKNIKAVPDLKGNISVLNTNQDLASVRLNDSDSPLQSVLDALPASANETALGSSLQKKLLAGVPGIAIETINVDPISGGETPANDGGPSQIAFTFSVSVPSATYSSLQALLQKIEKSIRPFNITNLSIEGQGDRVTMMAEGVSYYETAQTLELTDKVVKP